MFPCFRAQARKERASIDVSSLPATFSTCRVVAVGRYRQYARKGRSRLRSEAVQSPPEVTGTGLKPIHVPTARQFGQPSCPPAGFSAYTGSRTATRTTGWATAWAWRTSSCRRQQPGGTRTGISAWRCLSMRTSTRPRSWNWCRTCRWSIQRSVGCPPRVEVDTSILCAYGEFKMTSPDACYASARSSSATKAFPTAIIPRLTAATYKPTMVGSPQVARPGQRQGLALRSPSP